MTTLRKLDIKHVPTINDIPIREHPNTESLSSSFADDLVSDLSVILESDVPFLDGREGQQSGA